MKKHRKLLIFISIVVFCIFIFTFVIASTKSLESFKDSYKVNSIYERSYNHICNTWWIGFVFAPICLICAIISIKEQDRMSWATSVTLFLVILSLPFICLMELKRYSNSKENLNVVEEKINYSFDNGTSILYFEPKNPAYEYGTIVGEGSIRISYSSEGNADLNQLQWNEEIDKSLKKYIPKDFLNNNRIADKYLLIKDESNTITLLAYYDKQDFICFIIVEIE